MHHPLVIQTINASDLKEQLERAAQARTARAVRHARRQREAPRSQGACRPTAAPSIVISRGFNC